MPGSIFRNSAFALSASRFLDRYRIQYPTTRQSTINDSSNMTTRMKMVCGVRFRAAINESLDDDVFEEDASEGCCCWDWLSGYVWLPLSLVTVIAGVFVSWSAYEFCWGAV